MAWPWSREGLWIGWQLWHEAVPGCEESEGQRLADVPGSLELRALTRLACACQHLSAQLELTGFPAPERSDPISAGLLDRLTEFPAILRRLRGSGGSVWACNECCVPR
jgi:hypothetical protein